MTGDVIAATINDLFATNPQTRLAFTLHEIACELWEHPGEGEEEQVRELLTRARQILEDSGEHESFIPVTEHYFAEFDDDNQPRNALQAKRCIAGCGRGQWTAGVRRIRTKHNGANDRLSDEWLERLKRASSNAMRRFGDRVLLAHKRRALTRERAVNHLVQATKLAMPLDAAELRKLLPKGLRNNGVKITLTGKGKNLKDIGRVTKSGDVK